MRVYTDAVSLGVTNRQTVLTLPVADGPWTAAMLNAVIDQAGG